MVFLCFVNTYRQILRWKCSEKRCDADMHTQGVCRFDSSSDFYDHIFAAPCEGEDDEKNRQKR